MFMCTYIWQLVIMDCGNLLIDNNMKKGDLCARTGLSSSTIAKMTNCESVKLSVLEKICKELDCNFGDLVDYVPDEEEK